MDDARKEAFASQMLEMLTASDREFIPPLSARSSTTQKDLSGGESSPEGIQLYFGEMKKQQILGAFEEERLLGWISYRENYTCPEIGEDTLPNIYLSTLVSRPEARGRGLTRSLYDHLFHTLCPDRNVFTRTWSTNAIHIRILEKFGFRLLCRKVNDRGNGIDTVYFRKDKIF